MLSIIVSIFIAIAFIALGIFLYAYLEVGEFGIASIMLGVLLLFYGPVCIQSTLISYNELPAEVYSLYEIQDGLYWYQEENKEGSIVMIYIMKPDGSVAKESFDEELVTFHQGENAQVSIVKEDAYYPDQYKLWVLGEPNEEDRIKSVSIIVPGNNALHADAFAGE